MLSIRFVAVKDVLDTVQDLSVEEGGPQQDNHTAQWSIQVQHGEQRQRTRSIAIAEDAEENQQSQVETLHLLRKLRCERLESVHLAHYTNTYNCWPMRLTSGNATKIPARVPDQTFRNKFPGGVEARKV